MAPKQFSSRYDDDKLLNFQAFESCHTSKLTAIKGWSFN